MSLQNGDGKILWIEWRRYHPVRDSVLQGQRRGKKDNGKWKSGMEGYEEKGKEMGGIREGIKSPYFSGHVCAPISVTSSVSIAAFSVWPAPRCSLFYYYTISTLPNWRSRYMATENRNDITDAKKQLIHRTEFWLTGFCINIYVDAETGQPERSTVEEYILPMKLSVFWHCIHEMHWRQRPAVAALHKGASGQMTWLNNPPLGSALLCFGNSVQ